MDREQQEPHPPGVDRVQDAQFLDRVDTALDRHRQNHDRPPSRLHEMVIHTQAPTPDANIGVGLPVAAPSGEAVPKLTSSAATAQFFGAGGPMCVLLYQAQIASDLSVPGRTGCVGSTSQHCKVARRLGRPVLHPRSWVLEIRVRGLEHVGGVRYCNGEPYSCTTGL